MGRGGGCGQRRRHARVHRAEVGARLDIKASGGRHSPEIYPLTAKRRFASTVQTERAPRDKNAKTLPEPATINTAPRNNPIDSGASDPFGKPPTR